MNGRHLNFALLGTSLALFLASVTPVPASVTITGNQDEYCYPMCGPCGEKEAMCAPGVETPEATPNPVFLHRGSVIESETDISIGDVVGTWSHTRTYDSLLAATSGTYPAPNGERWFMNASQAYLEESGSTVFLYDNASTKHRITSSGGVYTVPHYMSASFEKTGSGSTEKFVLTDFDTGRISTFYSFSTSHTATERGKIWERTTREFEYAGEDPREYAYSTGGSTADYVTQITLSNGLEVFYIYNGIYDAEPGKLKEIQVKDGSATLKKVEYLYFGMVSGLAGSPTPHSDIGRTGDLVQVKVSTRESDQGSWIVHYTQYRYYRDGSDGYDHQLKSVYDSAAIDRLIVDNSYMSTPEHVLEWPDSSSTGGSAAVSAFASRSFTYYTDDLTDTDSSITTPFGSDNLSVYGGDDLDEDGFVKTESVAAGCGACGTTSGLTKTYFYMASNVSASLDTVQRIVVEDTEDANGSPHVRTVYGLNPKGVALRKAVIENPMSSTTFTAWCESTVIGTSTSSKDYGRVTERRSPSAHTGVDTDSELADFLDPPTGGNESTLLDSVGLVRIYTYNAEGRRTASQVKKGEGGTVRYLSRTEWGEGMTDQPSHLPIKTYQYRSTIADAASGTGGEETSFSYAFWDSAETVLQTVTTTPPTISTSQKGSGEPTTIVDYFDKRGRRRWSRDGESNVTYYSYHPDLARQTYMMVDVETDDLPSDITSGTADFEEWSDEIGAPPGDTVPALITSTKSAAGDNLELVTKTFVDPQGRIKRVVRPGGTEHYTVYEDGKTIRFPFWESGAGDRKAAVEVTLFDDGGRPTERYAVSPALAATDSGAPIGLMSHAQNKYVSWETWEYGGVSGRLEESRRYHDIPLTTNDDGDVSTHYYLTVYQYDDVGREEFRVDVASGEGATGVEQVTKTVYDVLGRVVEVHRGVSPTGSGGDDMGSSYSSKPTLRKVSTTEYDAGGVGDGHVTETRSYFDSGANDYTLVKYHRTFRGHVRGIEPHWMDDSTETAIGPISVHDVDWEGKATATAGFSASPTWTGSGGVLYGDDGYDDFSNSTTRSGRVTLVERKFDDLGRQYEQLVYAINSSGSKQDYLRTWTYYDRNSRVAIEYEYAGRTMEYAYDGAGRRYQTRTVAYFPSGAPYLTGAVEDAGAVVYFDPAPDPSLSQMDASGGGNDHVVEIEHLVFDMESNVTETHHLDLNAGDTNGMSFTSDDYVRRSVFSWYDEANRLVVEADRGSGGTVWKHQALPSRGSVPSASSASELVTKFTYSEEGELVTITDPRGEVTRFTHDDLGRVTKEERDYTGADEISLLTEYDGLGNVTERTDGRGKSTTYLFEDAVSRSLNTEIISPDSSDTSSSGADQIKLEYAYDGAITKRTDQRGVVIDFEYNGRRQQVSQKVNLPDPTDVDGSVLSLWYTYDGVGRLTAAESFDNVEGDETALNSVERTYNDFGQVSQSDQDHGIGGTLGVKYTFEHDGSGLFTNGARLARIEYPSTRKVDVDYGASNGINDRLHRLELFESDSGADYVQYVYTGAGRLIEVEYPTPGVTLDRDDDAAAGYEGFDRFGRVQKQYWKGTTDIDLFTYTFDYAGNPTSREIGITDTEAADKDQIYGYDGLHRLTTFDQGDLSMGTISSPVLEQDWTLDDSGNWTTFAWDDGTAVSQSREYNDANEIDDDNSHDDAKTNVISGSGAADWEDPLYDAAGNMIEGPRAGDEAGTLNTYIYDAWNRLVTVKDGSTIISQYEYDALHRRVVHENTQSAGTQTLHYYYSTAWQVLEVRREVYSIVDSDPIEQFIWHPYYIDAVAVRFYDPSASGTAVEHFYTSDANANVTAVVDSSESVLERYEYEPYGRVTVLDADFSDDTNGLSDILNNVLYTGRWWDGQLAGYWYRYRTYSPAIGRFMQRDPIGAWGDSLGSGNGYLYVGAQPVVMVDPSGAAAETWEYAEECEECCSRTASAKVGETLDCVYEFDRCLNDSGSVVGLVGCSTGFGLLGHELGRRAMFLEKFRAGMGTRIDSLGKTLTEGLVGEGVTDRCRRSFSGYGHARGADNVRAARGRIRHARRTSGARSGLWTAAAYLFSWAVDIDTCSSDYNACLDNVVHACAVRKAICAMNAKMFLPGPVDPRSVPEGEEVPVCHVLPCECDVDCSAGLFRAQ